MNYFLRISQTTVQLYTNNYHDVGTISLNKWQHIITTFDGTAFKTYINGKLSNSYVETPTGYSNNNTIGISGYDLTSDPTNGQIDDVRIYNYALTGEQVKTLYNNGSVSFQ